MPSVWNLPADIKSRSIRVNDLNMHILEAGDPTKPLVLLLHGFPEFSYSWRKIIVPLVESGYYVVAPDQRGAGRTTSDLRDNSSPIRYEEDPSPYRIFNLTRDIVALAFALGHRTVHAVVGHDFGSAVAGACALVRPDMFHRVVLMSAPFTGAPSYPLGESAEPSSGGPRAFFPRLKEGLAALTPPKKHYTWYYSQPEANADMHAKMQTPTALHAFLRAYYHVKSADWAQNVPHPLSRADAGALAELPGYYIMPREKTMPETVLADAPAPDEVHRNAWLPDAELGVYVDEYWRTGFQGGLNWYRCTTDATGRYASELLVFSGKTVEVPAMFISGEKDWGVWQSPGAVEKMKEVMHMGDDQFVLIPGAGHWVQQEQPDAVVEKLRSFLRQD